MNNSEFAPNSDKGRDETKSARDARFRWDIERSRQDPQFNYGEMEPAVRAEFDSLVSEGRVLWEKLNTERRTGMLIIKDDVDLVLQKLDSALSISNDEVVADLREEFLKEYPNAGARK